LPGCVAEQAAGMAERLKRSVLEKPYHIHRDMLSVTASIGIATSRGRSPLVVLREAERALGDAMEIATSSQHPSLDEPSEPSLLRLP
jgi:two-component system cell cycle response regulator